MVHSVGGSQQQRRGQAGSRWWRGRVLPATVPRVGGGSARGRQGRREQPAAAAERGRKLTVEAARNDGAQEPAAARSPQQQQPAAAASCDQLARLRAGRGGGERLSAAPAGPRPPPERGPASRAATEGRRWRPPGAAEAPQRPGRGRSVPNRTSSPAGSSRRGGGHPAHPVTTPQPEIAASGAQQRELHRAGRGEHGGAPGSPSSPAVVTGAESGPQQA